MLKVVSFCVLVLAALPPQARAQEPAAAAAAVVTSAVNGASFIIDERGRTPGLQRVSTSAAAASADTPAFALRELTPAQLGVLEKLNRINASRLGRLAALVRPAEWADDELAFSPFPSEWAWAADKAKAIVVDQAAQAFGAYEHGRLVRWGPVSTGESGQTPAGVFHLSWRSRGHRSSIDPSWYLPWYFNFIPSRGIAFHEYSLPGRAASHGCVRMLRRDAQWLYHWGETPTRDSEGTTVVVLNCPDSTRPWQTEEFLRTGVSLPAAPSAASRSCAGGAGSATAGYRRALR